MRLTAKPIFSTTLRKTEVVKRLLMLVSAVVLQRTPLLTLALGLTVVISGEVVFRMPAVQRHLPDQGISLTDFSFNTNFSLLDTYHREHPELNCLILGSSMVQFDLHIQTFQAAYAHVSDEPLVCFNFGVDGLTAPDAGAVAEALVQEYHPRLLIYGTSQRDYIDYIDSDSRSSLGSNAWVSSQNGRFSLQGWLIDHSYWLRYGRSLRLQSALARGVIAFSSDFEHLRLTRLFEAGGRPFIYYQRRAPRFAAGAPVGVAKGLPAVSAAGVEGLRRILDLRRAGVAVLIVEMPSHAHVQTESFGGVEPARRYLEAAINQADTDSTAVYWSTDDLPFTTDDYADGLHLYFRGALKFSDWLGKQVGQAVNLGLLEGRLPASVHRQPPLRELALESITPSLSEDTRQRYADHAARFTLVPPEALVFNPAQGSIADPLALERLLLVIQYDTRLAANAPPSERLTHLLDLASVLGHMRYANELTAEQQSAVARWRASKQPAELLAVGIQYLLYTDQWLSYLTDEEFAVLNDPARYAPLGAWYHEVTRETYFLYRPIAEE